MCVCVCVYIYIYIYIYIRFVYHWYVCLYEYISAHTNTLVMRALFYYTRQTKTTSI